MSKTHTIILQGKAVAKKRRFGSGSNLTTRVELGIALDETTGEEVISVGDRLRVSAIGLPVQWIDSSLHLRAKKILRHRCSVPYQEIDDFKEERIQQPDDSFLFRKHPRKLAGNKSR